MGLKKIDKKYTNKQSSGNDLRRNFNLLNMSLECKIIQYNLIQLELRPRNQTKLECPKALLSYSLNSRGTTCFSTVNREGGS